VPFACYLLPHVGGGVTWGVSQSSNQWKSRANILSVPHSDTSPAAQAVQLEILRAMSGEQRLLLAFEMSWFARELAKEGIRREHPEWPEARVARELLRLAFFPAPLPSWIP
jgi:hypothetical protein